MARGHRKSTARARSKAHQDQSNDRDSSAAGPVDHNALHSSSRLINVRNRARHSVPVSNGEKTAASNFRTLQDEARLTGVRRQFLSTATNLRHSGISFVSAGAASTKERNAKDATKCTTSPEKGQVEGKHAVGPRRPQGPDDRKTEKSESLNESAQEKSQDLSTVNGSKQARVAPENAKSPEDLHCLSQVNQSSLDTSTDLSLASTIQTDKSQEIDFCLKTSSRAGSIDKQHRHTTEANVLNCSSESDSSNEVIVFTGRSALSNRKKGHGKRASTSTFQDQENTEACGPSTCKSVSQSHSGCLNRTTSSAMMAPPRYDQAVARKDLELTDNVASDDEQSDCQEDRLTVQDVVGKKYPNMRRHSVRRDWGVRATEDSIFADYIANMDQEYNTSVDPDPEDVDPLNCERLQGTQHPVDQGSRGNSGASWVQHDKLVSENGDMQICDFEKITEQRTHNRVARIRSENGSEDSDDDITSYPRMDYPINLAMRGLDNDTNCKSLHSFSGEPTRTIENQQMECSIRNGDLDKVSEGVQLPKEPVHLDTQSTGECGRSNDTDKASKPRWSLSPTSTVNIIVENEVVRIDSDCTLSRRKKKNSSFAIDDASDHEIYATPNIPMLRGREKKSQRKQEREDFHSHSIFNSKRKTSARPSVGFSISLSMEDVKEEIGDFLISDRQQLCLPPMNKLYRKAVHEIANNFQLKSKSSGSGHTRSPNLFKTSRSKSYDVDDSDGIHLRMSQIRGVQGMGKKVDRSSYLGRKNDSTKFSKGTNASAATYKDGEIVGAAAPELGQDNRGRAILERMGWSTGTALGALNNKGILQPVAHVVKTSKAGLG
ncbi:MAG: hypothetical protein M1825_001558 [Sarcosagium campestre]|nr:MAG: hypothetical protein M1825_001558 [Sarcosagium campestre]